MFIEATWGTSKKDGEKKTLGTLMAIHLEMVGYPPGN